MGTRIGFVASEKGAEKECDVGLGLRMQKPTKTHHHHHGDDDDETSLLVDNNGGFSGPLYSNASNNNNNSSMGDIYEALSYTSSGAMVPKFTASQRQELEAQTMIYKYMMASVPVPAQLLMPITKTTPFASRSLELGISGNSSDAEPWRCRRTDGKKWRCSRNVVPEQKYCERHSHKSRPRSRKHVELNSHFNTNHSNLPYSKPSNFLEQREKNPPAFSASAHEQPRNLEWFMKGHEVANPNQDWHQVMQAKSTQLGLNTGNNDHHNHQIYQQQAQGFFLDPNMETPNQQTRRFIDAWSERDPMEEAQRKTPFSSLSLSMNATRSNSGEESEENSHHLGFGIEGDFLRSHWMINNNNNETSNSDVNDAGSWNNGLSPGGPLAEALCLGIAGSSTRESSSKSS